MSEQAASRADGENPAGDLDDPMEEFRTLVLGDDRERIRRAIARLEDPRERAIDIGNVLPEALEIGRKKDARLTEAMAPSVEEVIRASVRARPHELADALFPVMGPAIRKSILDTLARMIEGFNRAIEHSLTPRSIGWRFEAWKTGRPFAEVVLIKTVLYRVEQVFLIHRKSGLLLQHVIAAAAPSQDGDMVSGMLTAIQDFARDAFDAGEAESLDSFAVGSTKVWVEYGPDGILACVIRGTPPGDLRTRIEETLEHLSLEQSAAFDGFEGDATPFERVRPRLDALLEERTREPVNKRRRFPAAWITIAILLALATWGFLRWRAATLRWEDFIGRLQDEPGIELLRATDEGVSVLRDPLATPIEPLLEAAGLDADEVSIRERPFVSLDDAIIERRGMKQVAPPEGVELTVAAGVVTLRGRADATWLARARTRLETMVGISEVRADQLETITSEREARWRDLVRLLGETEGIVVNDSAREGDRLRIDGLRDPLAPSVEALAERAGVPRDELDARFRAFESTDAAMIRLRAAKRLGAPAGVVIDVADGALVLSGRADEEWARDARRVALSIPGVSSLDETRLTIVRQDDQARWDALLERIRRTPGLAIGETGRSGSTFRLGVLRDPLAESVAKLLSEVGLSPERVDVVETGLLSTDPRIVASRARHVLDVPPGVSLSVEGGRLLLAGEAPRRFILRAQRLGPPIHGVTSLDRSSLVEAPDDQSAAWGRLVAAIDAEPGLDVMAAEEREDDFLIRVLRDPLARDPRELLRAQGERIEGVTLDVIPFSSTDATLVVARARIVLAPPESVELTLEGRVLVATGRADHAWLRRAERTVVGIRGIERFDTSRVIDANDAQFTALRRGLESRMLFFARGGLGIDDADREVLDLAAADLRALIDLARTMEIELRVEVIGFTDQMSSEANARRLATSRANSAIDALVRGGIPKAVFEPVGLGGPVVPRSEREEERPGSRRVTFRVAP